MITSPVSLTDAIRNAILYQLNGIHTSMPGQIVSYDFTTQKASVQPTINKQWTDNTISPMPVLENVPVIFPQSGGASITFPVVPGDTVLIVVCERSITEWILAGGRTTPADPRKLDLTDAVCIPGLKPFNSIFPAVRTNNTDSIFTYAGSSFTINATGQINIISSSGSSIDILPTGQINIVQTGGSQIDILPTGEIDITQAAGGKITLTATGTLKLLTTSTIALGTPTIELINQLWVLFTALQADPALWAILTTSKPFVLQFIANMAPITGIQGTLP